MSFAAAQLIASVLVTFTANTPVPVEKTVTIIHKITEIIPVSFFFTMSPPLTLYLPVGRYNITARGKSQIRISEGFDLMRHYVGVISYNTVNSPLSEFRDKLYLIDGPGHNFYAVFVGAPDDILGEITPEVARLISEECSKQGKISSIHVAESESNQIGSLNKDRLTEIAKGVKSNFDQLVHLTNPKSNDLELVSGSGQNVVVCPRANATLNVGVTPLSKMLELGIRPLLGSDNVMINSPNMFRELEFTLKLMSVYHKSYIDPKELVKMATTNICGFEINSVVEKSLISEDNFAEFNVLKSFSKNPYLNICNRVETKNILYTINKKINV